MEKLTKFARILNVIMKVIFWVLFAGGCVLIVALIAIPFLPLELIGNFGTIDFGPVSFVLSPGYQIDTSGLKITLAVALVAGIVAIAAGCWQTAILRKALKPIAEGKPFVSEVSNALKQLAWATLISGIVISAMGCLSEYLLASIYDISELFLNDYIVGFSVDVDYSFNFIIPTIFLFLLHYIFKYGVELQQQADDTI